MNDGALRDLRTLLRDSGYLRNRNGTYWRILEEKTDIVELLPVVQTGGADHRRDRTVAFGTCYSFLPDVFSVSDRIEGLLTRPAVGAHISSYLGDGGPYGSGQPSISRYSDPTTSSSLIDRVGATVLPLLESLDTPESLVEMLESDSSSVHRLGVGPKGSFRRNFLIGFAYVRVGQRTAACECLSEALAQHSEMTDDLRAGALPKSAPIHRERTLIEEALGRLGRT